MSTGYVETPEQELKRLREQNRQWLEESAKWQTEIERLRAERLPTPPEECKTEAEKIAFAFGWWSGMVAKREAFATRAHGIGGDAMTREEIIRMAREAGLQVAADYDYRGSFEKLTFPEREEFLKLLHFANLIEQRAAAIRARSNL